MSSWKNHIRKLFLFCPEQLSAHHMLHFVPVRPKGFLKMKWARHDITSFAPRFSSIACHIYAAAWCVEAQNIPNMSIKAWGKIALPLATSMLEDSPESQNEKRRQHQHYSMLEGFPYMFRIPGCRHWCSINCTQHHQCSRKLRGTRTNIRLHTVHHLAHLPSYFHITHCRSHPRRSVNSVQKGNLTLHKATALQSIGITLAVTILHTISLYT